MADKSASKNRKENGKDSYEILEGSGRIPPQAIEVEEAVLGAMLIEHEAATIALQMLRIDDFYRPAHRHIFETIYDLYERDNPLDLLTVENELRDKNLLDTIGGSSYLSDLTRSVSSAANIDYHAQIITEKAIKRNLILNCTEVIKNAYDSTSDAFDILDEAEQRIFDISNNKTRSNAQAIGDVLKDTLQYLEEIRGKPSGITGIPAGLDVDHLTSGFQPGDLVIIAARPSMGKTAFALTAARNAALFPDEALKTNVALFSLEMSSQQLVQRLLTMEGRIDAQLARSGRLKDEDFKRLIDAASRLFTAKLFIDDTPALSVMELRTKCRRLKSEHDIGMIIVDYLQLMTANTRDNSNREQEIATISRGLKSLAKELNVPVIALSQLSRAVEQRGGDKRPQLSDLRESGCLTGDTLIPVHNKKSRVPIKDLLGQNGFEVWALNQNSKKLETVPVSNVFSTGTKPVFELEVRTGRKIKATANHKFLTINGWKRLDELETDDYIALPRVFNSSVTDQVDKDQLALLGHLIGDGCTLPRHVIQYTTREADLAEHVSQLAKNVFGKDVKPRIQKERTWYQVYLTSTRHHTHNTRSAVSEWLDELDIWGLRSYEKKVPELIFGQPKENIAHFLKHLWTTDGSILMRRGKKPYPSIYYSTSSFILARDVQSLLLRVGINARVKLVPQGDKGRNQHHVVIGGKTDILVFAEKIGTFGEYKTRSLKEIVRFILHKKENTNRDIIPVDVWQTIVKPEMVSQGITHRQLHKGLGMSYSGMTIFKQNMSRRRAERVATAVGSDDLRCLSRSDIYWDKVCSITDAGVDEVFDITVPEYHNFVANDIIVHNSIEQDADVVMFLYRPEYYGITTTSEGHSTKGLAEVIVGKQRNGPTGVKRLFFVENYARFENFTQAETFSGGGDYADASGHDSGPAAAPPPTYSVGDDDDDAPF